MHLAGRTQAVSRCGDRQLQHSPSFHTGCEVERRTTLSLAFIPNLCCHLEHLGKGSEQGLAQQGAGFGAALGWCCDTVRLFLGLHLTEKIPVEELLPSVTISSLGCISRAASVPWFALLRSLGSLIPTPGTV